MPSAPRWRQGPSDIRVVCSSISRRSAAPSSVRAPSPSSRPRSTSPAEASLHCSGDHPRLCWAKPTVKPVPVATWVISASMPESPAESQRVQVGVAAVLAQERHRVPEHEVRLVGPGQVGVGGVERAVLAGGALAGLAGELGGLGHRGRGHLLAQQPPQRRVGGAQPGVDDVGGCRGRPDARHRARDQRRVEVEERGRHDAGPDRAHRGGALGEVLGARLRDPRAAPAPRRPPGRSRSASAGARAGPRGRRRRRGRRCRSVQPRRSPSHAEPARAPGTLGPMASWPARAPLGGLAPRRRAFVLALLGVGAVLAGADRDRGGPRVPGAAARRPRGPRRRGARARLRRQPRGVHRAHRAPARRGSPLGDRRAARPAAPATS